LTFLLSGFVLLSYGEFGYAQTTFEELKAQIADRICTNEGTMLGGSQDLSTGFVLSDRMLFVSQTSTFTSTFPSVKIENVNLVKIDDIEPSAVKFFTVETSSCGHLFFRCRDAVGQCVMVIELFPVTAFLSGMSIKMANSVTIFVDKERGASLPQIFTNFLIGIRR
jgi:hypothetical protein